MTLERVFVFVVLLHGSCLNTPVKTFQPKSYIGDHLHTQLIV